MKTLNLINPIAPKYFKLLEDKHRFQVLWGGAGSGKSFFAAQKIMLRLLKEIPVDGKTHTFLVVRKVGTTIRDSTYKLFKTVATEFGVKNRFVKFRETDLRVRFTNGNEIVHIGLDDVEKVKSIHAISGIWIEEATELTQSDFMQLNTRLRGITPYYKQITITFNPISPFHWLKKYFFDNQAENTNEKSVKLHTTYHDNPFLDEEYKQELESYRQIDYNHYLVYTKGQWGSSKGLIYNIWETKEHPKNFDEIIFGLDFGFNNPTALIRLGIKDKEIFAREIIYETKLTNSDLIAKLETLKIPRYAEIYADAAEPQRIEEITRAGYNIKPAIKAVKEGIDFVKRLKIYSHESNIELNKELVSYKWKETKNNELIDEPVKFLDHALDAVRYALYTHLKYRVTEKDAKTIQKELNEVALKKYAEEYMDMKYSYIQKGIEEKIYLLEIQKDLMLNPEDFKKILDYVKDYYDY